MLVFPEVVAQFQVDGHERREIRRRRGSVLPQGTGWNMLPFRAPTGTLVSRRGALFKLPRARVCRVITGRVYTVYGVANDVGAIKRRIYQAGHVQTYKRPVQIMGNFRPPHRVR